MRKHSRGGLFAICHLPSPSLQEDETLCVSASYALCVESIPTPATHGRFGAAHSLTLLLSLCLCASVVNPVRHRPATLRPLRLCRAEASAKAGSDTFPICSPMRTHRYLRAGVVKNLNSDFRLPISDHPRCEKLPALRRAQKKTRNRGELSSSFTTFHSGLPRFTRFTRFHVVPPHRLYENLRKAAKGYERLRKP
jgi:hypothetical protein